MTATAKPHPSPGTHADVEQLWGGFADRLRAFIASRVSNHADVDDLLQEVFIKIQRGAGQLRDEDRLVPWMFRIAHNTIIDHYRSAPRRRERPVDPFREEEGHPGADAPSDDPSLIRAEIAACVRALLDELPDHHRQALQLVELEGTSQTEAARIVGISVSGMKSRVQRARSQVFDRLSALCELTVDRRGGPLDCVPATDRTCP